jgi:hypothetical protein
VKERDTRETVSQRFPTEREEANQGKTRCRLCLYYIFALQALVTSVVLTLLAFSSGLPSTGIACKACCTCVKTFSSSTSSPLTPTTGQLFVGCLYPSTLPAPSTSAIWLREGQNLLKPALLGHRVKDFDTAHTPRPGENGRKLDNLTIKDDDSSKRGVGSRLPTFALKSINFSRVVFSPHSALYLQNSPSRCHWRTYTV